MKILEILQDTAPQLRVKCKDVENFTTELSELIGNMWATMKVAGGVGLAANQVGADIRVICIDSADFSGVMINPHWVPEDKIKLNLAEGCLSLPGKNVKKSRYATINVSFLDETGKKNRIQVRGLVARIVQHECDHLDGILMTDKEY